MYILTQLNSLSNVYLIRKVPPLSGLAQSLGYSLAKRFYFGRGKTPLADSFEVKRWPSHRETALFSHFLATAETF
jgi:hypothetical protein